MEEDSFILKLTFSFNFSKFFTCCVALRNVQNRIAADEICFECSNLSSTKMCVLWQFSINFVSIEFENNNFQWWLIVSVFRNEEWNALMSFMQIHVPIEKSKTSDCFENYKGVSNILQVDGHISMVQSTDRKKKIIN